MLTNALVAVRMAAARALQPKGPCEHHQRSPGCVDGQNRPLVVLTPSEELMKGAGLMSMACETSHEDRVSESRRNPEFVQWVRADGPLATAVSPTRSLRFSGA